MKLVLAAVDGSEPSWRALEFAVNLAGRIKTELAILIVREFLVGRRDVVPVLNEQEFRTVREKAESIAAAGGLTESRVLSPKSRDAAYTIVETAIEQKADLIVMGASGKGSVKTMLLGSVSSEVLRKSACPVTIVH